jgi:hypothetical protein
MNERYITMNKTLKWVKFESIMTSLFLVNGISLSKFNRFKNNHISILEIS